jgi:hypothetical protein
MQINQHLLQPAVQQHSNVACCRRVKLLSKPLQLTNRGAAVYKNDLNNIHPTGPVRIATPAQNTSSFPKFNCSATANDIHANPIKPRRSQNMTSRAEQIRGQLLKLWALYKAQNAGS